MAEVRHTPLIVVLFILSFLLSGCAQRTAPAPVVEVTTSVSASSATKNSINSHKYTVKSGETLYSIAWRAGKDVRSIASINNISPPYKIFPGQELLLSNTSKQRAAKQSTKSSAKSLSKSTGTTLVDMHKKPVAQSQKQEYVKTIPEQKTYENKSVKRAKTPANDSFSTKVKRWVWPSSGKVVAKFSLNANGVKGIDIANKRGTKVGAAADGKVVYAGNALRGYGNLIIVKHNDDYLSAYAHNDKILVKEQQYVKAGQTIAKMGDTGAERVMLHFEIRFRGKSVNPAKYLPKK